MQRVKNVVKNVTVNYSLIAALAVLLGILKIPKRAVWNSFIVIGSVRPLIAHYTPTLTYRSKLKFYVRF